MRDGVVLRADVYRPDGDGPWPTLLTRTPYGKQDPRNSATLDPVQAARRGFMVVVQDTRGQGRSDGEWMPLHYEQQDGYDSVEWAARLPGSNGRVGMYGGSYCGSTQWMAALQQPPSLGAISPFMTWSDPMDGLLSRGGALELGLAIPWTLWQGARRLATSVPPDDDRDRRVAHAIDDIDQLPCAGYWDLPVREMRVLSHGFPDIGTIAMLSEPGLPERSRVAGHHDRVTVPSVHIGGWHDIFLQGTLDNYTAMTTLGRPAHLVVGPWAHGNQTLTDPTGALSFGIRSNGFAVAGTRGVDVNALQLAWMRHYLAPGDDKDLLSAQPPVRIFVMGRNAWREEAAWPLERARVERWYLSAGGGLTRDQPRATSPTTDFSYDPMDPVPTIGGHTSGIPATPPGPFDQAAIEARDDVCVFTSEPLETDLEVTGRVRASLYVDSSARSTDWVARLCDVHPDGRSFNICDGIVRVADGAERGGRVNVDLWSTSNVFLAGHCLRVHVTSSSFPRWDRNLNTGDQRRALHELARQRLHHEADRASYVELPVVDG